MNILKMYLIMGLVLCIAPSWSVAQEARSLDDIHDLSKEELEVFKERTVDKINEVQKYFSLIGSKSESIETKQLFAEMALVHFINDGDGVTIEVSYIKDNQERRFFRPLKVYLKKLSELPYARVDIKTSQSCIVSNFHKKGEDENGQAVYTATATVLQEFKAFNKDGQVAYTDVTRRTYEIELTYSYDPLKDKYRWIVLLGDINVAETKQEASSE